MSALAFTLVFAGFVALSLAMDRHHRGVFKKMPSKPLKHLVRCVGLTLVAAGWSFSVVVWGGSVGTVAWLGIMTVAAVGVTLLHTYTPRAVPWLGAAAPLLAATIGLGMG